MRVEARQEGRRQRPNERGADVEERKERGKEKRADKEKQPENLRLKGEHGEGNIVEVTGVQGEEKYIQWKGAHHNNSSEQREYVKQDRFVDDDKEEVCPLCVEEFDL